MKCPNCETLLAISEREGVEIDYCPTCRGMWLDRGELDKLLVRARREEDIRREEYSRRELEDSDDRRPSFGERYDLPRQTKPHRKSFWREIFDFD